MKSPESLADRPQFSPEILKKKTAEYQERFPTAMLILEIGGVHPTRKGPIYNPYKESMDHGDFSNIGEHCVAVAFAAEKITAALGNPEIQDHVIQRALAHDSNKRFEILRRNAQGEAAYSVQAYQNITQHLRELGLSGQLVDYLAEAGSETGHNSFPHFVTLDAALEPVLHPERTLAQKIVHLVDDMTYSPKPGTGPSSTSWFLTTAERQEASQFRQYYPWMYREGFGFDFFSGEPVIGDMHECAGRVQLVHPKTYAQWQRDISRMICVELQQQISPQNQQDPEIFIAELVNEGL